LGPVATESRVPEGPVGVPGLDADALFPEMYQELRRIARARLRRSESITLLDTTGLVHESYLRFQKMGQLAIQDRGQFLGYAARVMRFVVIDFIRQRRAERRGGGAIQITLGSEILDSMSVDDEHALRVHDALEELSKVDARAVQVVEMRCFAGLDEQEIAMALGVTDRTVRREWKKARLLLKAALQ
jgi:RNA polymerase sigma factor (TIGR02999 family)